jgi:SNF2 family DNA or RNA helicase
VVVFANYTATLDLMEQKLKDAAISYVRVDGAVTGQDRVQAQEQFQSGAVQVFLGQMSAAGISMDLFRTPYSIALDHPWKAEDYAQALARTHRRGQSQHCTHWDLYTNQLQKRVVARLRSGEAFNAETAEWQEVKTSC